MGSLAVYQSGEQMIMENLLNEKLSVISITRNTIHNGPGYRVLILFKGCPLRCKWCSTPESQENREILSCNPRRCIGCGNCARACPEGAVSFTESGPVIDRETCTNCMDCTKVCHSKTLTPVGKKMTVREILREVEKCRDFMEMSGGGVTLSGGEFTYEEFGAKMTLVQELHKRGISIGVDTCGYAYSQRYRLLAPYVDFYLWDIKQMDPEKHQELTGKDNAKIFRNLMLVNEQNIDLYFRCPLIPGMTDDDANIHGMCALAQKMHHLKSIDLLPIHHLGKARYDMIGMPYPIEEDLKLDSQRLEDIEKIVKSYDLPVRIIG